MRLSASVSSPAGASLEAPDCAPPVKPVTVRLLFLTFHRDFLALHCFFLGCHFHFTPLSALNRALSAHRVDLSPPISETNRNKSRAARARNMFRFCSGSIFLELLPPFFRQRHVSACGGQAGNVPAAKAKIAVRPRATKFHRPHVPVLFRRRG